MFLAEDSVSPILFYDKEAEFKGLLQLALFLPPPSHHQPGLLSCFPNASWKKIPGDITDPDDWTVPTALSLLWYTPQKDIKSPQLVPS